MDAVQACARAYQPVMSGTVEATQTTVSQNGRTATEESNVDLTIRTLTHLDSAEATNRSIGLVATELHPTGLSTSSAEYIPIIGKRAPMMVFKF